MDNVLSTWQWWYLWDFRRRHEILHSPKNMYSDSNSRNYSILRIRFGPLHCRNHVVKLFLSQINQFIGCCGSFSISLVLFLLHKLSRYHVDTCHQGAEHVTQVMMYLGTTILNVFQIFLHPLNLKYQLGWWDYYSSRSTTILPIHPTFGLRLLRPTQNVASLKANFGRWPLKYGPGSLFL